MSTTLLTSARLALPTSVRMTPQLVSDSQVGLQHILVSLCGPTPPELPLATRECLIYGGGKVNGCKLKMETVTPSQVYVIDIKTLLVTSVFLILSNTFLHRDLYFNKPSIVFKKKPFLK